MKSLAALPLVLALGACAGPAKNSGFLSSYEGLAPRTDTVRASISERKDDPALAEVRKVAIAPTVLAATDAVWLTPAERELLLREIDAQLCFELSERYEITSAAEATDAARVRAAVTGVRPTGRVGSAAAAVGSFFIPGPIGLRPPGTLGALAAEAEMLDRAGEQVAAIVWSRAATAIGTDNPSLSRVGDALQFAEPFADAAARVMTAEEAEPRKVGRPDPCAEFGPRIRAAGFAARFATGLYVPEAGRATPKVKVEPQP